jgi:isoprenylcysteine carboxyl methyltransferase (ICMT) family protein YpbQ
VIAPLASVLAALVLSRLVEVNVAEVNTGRLKAQGWREVDGRGYPPFIALHVSLLVAVVWSAPNALLLWRRIRLENAALAPRWALG